MAACIIMRACLVVACLFSTSHSSRGLAPQLKINGTPGLAALRCETPLGLRKLRRSRPSAGRA